METRSFRLMLAVASVLASAGAFAAEPAAPDTSEWTCSKCPYDRGYRAEVEVGVGYVDDDSAKFGDYTGLDEEGAHAIVNAEGRKARNRATCSSTSCSTSASTHARSASTAASRAVTISGCSTTASAQLSGTRRQRPYSASAAAT